MITLKMNCGACPESYDAYDENDIMVGYLRLRHGRFTVECPDVGGNCVFESRPEGDGVFEPDERDYYLKWAVNGIQKWIADPNYSVNKKLAAPDVEYIIEGGYY